MREVRLQNGNILHMPEEPQRARGFPGVLCDCHGRMGNDFYFLPTDSCLRSDRTCNKVKPS